MARRIKGAPALAAAALALLVGACGHNPFGSGTWGGRSLTERECMARAMYFESNRSSEEGMTAVGTVVMNRLRSGRYPGSVCGVVGQRNQFASGVLSNPVSGRSWALALSRADAVMAGERHGRVGSAMHFHTAGYTFPYRNMAYVVAAGGNVFYDKRTPGSFTPVHPNVLVAQAQRPRPSESIVLARAEETRPEPVRREPVRLAQVEEREPPRALRSPPLPARPAVVQRRDEEETPRSRPRQDRIRLAHLDDDDNVPKALRHRTDAAPQGPLAGVALAYRNSASADRPKDDRGSKHTTAASSRDGSHAAKVEPKRFETPKPIRTAATAAPPPTKVKAGGQPLAYKEAKSKPHDTAAKLGWQRGPEPAKPAQTTGKKRP